MSSTFFSAVLRCELFFFKKKQQVASHMCPPCSCPTSSCYCQRPGTWRCRRCRAARQSPAGQPGSGRCCWAGWDGRTLDTWSARWTGLDPDPQLTAWRERERVRTGRGITEVGVQSDESLLCSPSDPRRRLWAVGSWWGLSWRWAACRSSSALWASYGLP